MSFATLMAVVRTHCETAGLATTPPIKVVRLCDVQNEDRQISVEYEVTITVLR